MYFAKHYNCILRVVMTNHRIPYDMIDKKKTPNKTPHRKKIPSALLLMEIVETYFLSSPSPPPPPLSTHILLCTIHPFRFGQKDKQNFLPVYKTNFCKIKSMQ